MKDRISKLLQRHANTAIYWFQAVRMNDAKQVDFWASKLSEIEREIEEIVLEQEQRLNVLSDLYRRSNAWTTKE
jgi:hypothetical protein